MRRFWGLFLVAAGVFALVLGLVVKFYAEPRIVRVPLDQQTNLVSISDGQSVVLDQGTGTVRQGLTLHANRLVRGIVDGSKDDGVAVWRTGNAVVGPNSETISFDDETIAFDRRTGEAVNCCGEQLNGDTNVRHTGLFFKFPFGTERTTYQFWDSTAKKAFPAVFVGKDTRDIVENGTKTGALDVYHFRSTIDPTPLTTGPVPPSYVGKTGDQPLQLTTTYSNVRDLWVEPITGEIVDGHEHPKETLRDESGADLLTAFETNIGYTPATRDANVVKANSDAKSAYFVSSVLPAALIGVGPLLIIAGLVLLYLVGRGGDGRDAAVGRRVVGRREQASVDVRDDVVPRQPGVVDVATAEAPPSAQGAEPGSP